MDFLLFWLATTGIIAAMLVSGMLLIGLAMYGWELLLRLENRINSLKKEE